MGYVYFGVGPQPGRVTIEATEDMTEDLAKYRSTYTSFHCHQVIETPRHRACRLYLHNLYGCRRLMVPANEPWFAIEPDEVDHAARLWSNREARFLENTKRVADLRSVRSSTRELESTIEDRQHHTRLKKLRDEIDALTFEKEFLEAELKLRIAGHAGLRGIASWQTKEGLRFDASSLKSDDPSLYERFRKPTRVRYFRVL